MINSIVNGSFHNANFSQRIWANEAVMKSELDGLLKQGLIQGKGARELARRLRDLAYFSAATGVEFALFRSKNEDILVRGTNRNCNVVGELGDEILRKKYEWVAHSHVDMGTLSPSTADKKTLRKSGQKESKLIGVDGMESKFDDSLF